MNTHVFPNQLKNYYTTLGLSETATLTAIKQAYRQLARQYHPDLNPHNKMAEVKFKEIDKAYKILSNFKKNQQNDLLVNHETRKAKAPTSNVNVYNMFVFALQGKNHYC